MKKISFCDNWQFFNDAGQTKTVRVPHDAMIERRRSADAKSGSAQGFFSGGRYVYEKTFDAPAAWRKQIAILEFEAVYRNAKVYVNEQHAGGTDYGYLPFFVELNGFLQYGKKNTVRVECENLDQPDARWYSGAGIFRPVWLHLGQGQVIRPESVKITTLSYSPARIKIESETEINAEIMDGETLVAVGHGTDFILDIPNAKLWSDETPFLYTCRVKTETDETEIPFGVRKIEWNANGLFINGKETKLRGGCLHHDGGILGAAVYAETEARRVKKLKEYGFNAVRSAHNPASRALLDACDRYGMYVMDESWDMWFTHKNAGDYAGVWKSNCETDLQVMVERDYNHPSVIMYSIGNELSEPATETGLQYERKFIDFLHTLDKTRAVTAGINLMILAFADKDADKKDDALSSANGANAANKKMNSTTYNMAASVAGNVMNRITLLPSVDKKTAACLDMLDIAGYNYASSRYKKEGKAHPNRVIVGSETFPMDIGKNWALVKTHPYVTGDFMWTAWDYLGEAGVGAWSYEADAVDFNKPYPWLLADTGAFDILGNPGAEAAYARAVWEQTDTPYIGVRPLNHAKDKLIKAIWRGTNATDSWSWRNCEGNAAVVEVYSRAPLVELFVGGKSLGRRKTQLCKAIYKTAYIPGLIRAVAYDAGGNILGEQTLSSAEKTLSLHISPEKKTAKPGDILYIPITVADRNGIVECNADERMTVSVTGGELLAFGAANPRTEETYQSGVFTSYYGRALAIVRAGNAEELTVTAKGQTLGEAELKIEIKKEI